MASFTSPTHFNIVALETFFTPLPPLNIPSPHTFTLTTYDRTSIAEIPERIRDAHVLITTTLPLQAESLSADVSPKLKLIAVMAAGTDSIDLTACTRRGIRVLNSPDCNSDAVAEHAVALYFAARRGIISTLGGLLRGDWPRKGSLMRTVYAAGKPPRGCRDEIAAIIGYGAVGKRVAKLFAALGMKVVIAARKAAPAAGDKITFEEALKTASVVVVCCPRTPETLGLFSEAEFAMMLGDAVLVNVSRGGIVDEQALCKALAAGHLAGAGVDVFDKEPASPETSPLLASDAQGLNLVVTPHTAWVGLDTTVHYQRVLQENILGFLMGDMEADRVKA
jgi:glycerate dehydrogenase